MKAVRIISVFSAAALAVAASGCQSDGGAGSGVVAQQSTQYITERQAELEALTHARVAEADAQGLAAALDKDDGRVNYDVDFISGEYDYDYEIDAITGEVISFDKELKETAPSEGSSALIGADAASKRALEHAGVSQEETSGRLVDLDKDDGRIYYNVEFRAGGIKYDYDIDAVSGEILSFEKETVFSPEQSGQQSESSATASEPAQSGSKYIGEDAAEKAALSHAGLSADAVAGLITVLDRDDGVVYYDVEFFSGNTKYDYDIDAVSGEVLSYDKDVKYTSSQSNQQSSQQTGGTTQTAAKYIGEAAAKKAALTHAGIVESAVTGLKTELDRDDGKVYYNVEFRSGGVEYEYDIDAVSGKVLSYDKDVKYTSSQSNQQSSQQTGGTTQTAAKYIGEAAAKKAALTHAGIVESAVTGLKTELDRDDGKVYYNVEFRSGGVEYEYDIDAVSGKVLSYDKDVKYTSSQSNQQSSQQTGGTTQTAAKYIGEAAAKKAALTHAGIVESAVTGLKTELDRDDGKVYYNVEFRSGGVEYEYDIDAVSGKVLKAEKDIDD